MSLSKVLEQIKVQKPLAEEDISQGPRETYSGREGRKRNAVSKLKDLKEEYITDLMQSAVFILVAGSGKEDFANIAKTEFKCFTADPEGFYKDLADRLPPVLYNQKTPPANLFDIMGRHLEDKATEMHITGYPLLVFHSKYQKACNGKDDFVQLIKEAINDQVGSEIAGIHIVRSLVDEAIAADHGGRITPIILTTNDEKFALDLKNNLGRIKSRAFLVAAGKGAKTVKSTEGAFTLKEVTNESVENILTNIRKLCR
jgi:hypothetical protein